MSDEDRTPSVARVRTPRLHRVFQPCTAGFVVLAVAVFLWGFGYKLSLYHPHPGPSLRLSVAKLWVETRQVDTGLRRLNPLPVSAMPALHVACRQAGAVVAGRAILAPMPLVARAVFLSQLPSRSPPARQSCPA